MEGTHGDFVVQEESQMRSGPETIRVWLFIVVLAKTIQRDEVGPAAIVDRSMSIT